MKCIEASFNIDEFEFKLDRFMHDEMTEDEHEKFCIHMMQCNYCHEQVRAQQKLRQVVKLEFLYEELSEAYEANVWKKVIELGEKMKALGSHEEVFPIRKKIQEAKQRGITVYFNGVLQKLDSYGNMLLSNIYDSCQIIVKYFEDVIFEKELSEDDLFEFSTSPEFADTKEIEPIYKAELASIFIQKGKATAKLQIKIG